MPVKSVSLQVADTYQPLFNLMSNEHGLTLTISEMDEIISAVNKISQNQQADIYCNCPHGFKEKNKDKCKICGGKWKGRPLKQ